MTTATATAKSEITLTPAELWRAVVEGAAYLSIRPSGAATQGKTFNQTK